MDTTHNSTVTSGRAEVASVLINEARELNIFYTSVAVAATALLLSGFQAGRKVLSRILWFFDSLLGGAPHTVSLPGPPGLPIVGNLLEVSAGWSNMRPLTDNRFS